MRAAAIAVVVLAGCTNFDYITADQCGNGVLELGEDCDLVAGAPLVETCVACRRACHDFLGCPDGWGCGDDGICRHGTLEFEESMAPLDLAVTDFVIADVDGDPFPDALGYGPAEVWLARGTPGPGFVIVDRYARTRADVRPAIGDLDGSAVLVDVDEPHSTVDVAMSTGARAIALLRTVGGRLVPAPQPWSRLTDAGLAAFPIRTATSAPFADLIAVAVAGADLRLTIEHPDRPPGVPLTVTGPSPCNPVSVRVTAADLDDDGRDELLIGCTGVTTVQVVGTAVGGGGDPVLVSIAALTLPDGLQGPLVTADLDDDGRTDVLASVGSGEFAMIADFAVIRQTSPLGFAAATRDARLGMQTVLAAADLDADGATDVIASGGIYLARAAELELAAAAPAAWARAVIADLDDDGVPDVVGASEDRLDTWIGAGAGTFALHVALTDGAVAGLTAGDLDGDGFEDVAALWGVGNDDVVRILYGHRGGGFDTLVSAGGVFANPLGFAAADLAVDDTILARDGAAELVLVGDAEVFVFAGSGARPPHAALDAGTDPRLLALGRFDPFASGETITGLDLLTLGADGTAATAFYGGATPVRDLEVRHDISVGVNYCTNIPAVFGVGNVDGAGGDELVEVSCPAQSPRLEYWHVVGDIGAPVLDDDEGQLVDATDAPTLASVADLDGDLAPEVIVVVDAPDVGVNVFHNLGAGVGQTAVRVGRDLVAGVTTGNLDADPELELVTGGAWVTAYDYTAASGPWPLLDPRDLTGSTDWTLFAPGIPRLHDLDGDGVEDLVLGGDQLRVFRAIPHTE